MVRRGMVGAALLALGLVAGCGRSDRERGEICLRQGDWSRALRFYDRAVEADPSDLEAREGLGKAALQKAERLAEEGRDRPTDWDAVVRELMIVQDARGDSALGEALYQARFRLARAVVRQGDTTLGLARLEELRLADPRRIQARNLEAILRFRRGELDRATDLFLENAAIDSNDVSAAFNLGLLFLHQGKAVQSTTFLLRAARRSPRDPEILYWLGRVGGGS